MSDLGTVGIWQGVFDRHPAALVREAIAEVEAMGWPTLWLPESWGRDPFVSSSILLGATERMVVATGIANIWGRDAVTMANAAKTLNEAYDGRFVLGLGVSHQPAVEGVRGHDYRKPYSHMREYLRQMDAAPFGGVEPAGPTTRVLAALGPKMLALGAESADGVHPYFVPVEHTAIAREAVGPDKIVATEQMVVLDTDPTRARAVARAHAARYLALPNYANNLIRMGYTEAEVTNADDRVIDAIVAWGTIDDAVARVRAHHDAGASHVCIQVLTADTAIPMAQWSELADALV